MKYAKDSLTVDTSKGRTTLSAMKLTFTPKIGLFKGSFKIYELETIKGKTKLKKYNAVVTGVVAEGIGYGQAIVKKPASGPWSFTVE